MSTSSYETRLLARANAPGQKPIWASQHEAIQATLSGNHQTNTDSFTNNGYPLIIPKATPKGAPNKFLLVSALTPYTDEYGNQSFFGAVGLTKYHTAVINMPALLRKSSITTPTSKFLLEHGTSAQEINKIINNHIPWAENSTTAGTPLALPLMDNWLGFIYQRKIQNLEDLLSAVIRESIAKLRIDDQGMPEDFDLNTALSSLTDADIPFHSLIRHLCAMAMYSNPSANNAMYSVSVENLEDPAFQLLHDRFMGGDDTRADATTGNTTDAAAGGATTSPPEDSTTAAHATTPQGGQASSAPLYKIGEIIGFPLEARTIGNNALIGIGQVQKILGPSIPLEGGVGGYSYEIQLERTGEDGERMTVTKKEKDISPLDVSPPSDGDGEDEETPFRDGRNAFPEPSAEDRQAHDVPRRPTCFFLGVRFPH